MTRLKSMKKILAKCFYFYSRKHYMVTVFTQTSHPVLRWRDFFSNFWTFSIIYTDIWYCSMFSKRGIIRFLWLWQSMLDIILFLSPYLKFPTCLFYTRDAIQLYFLFSFGNLKECFLNFFYYKNNYIKKI